MEASEAEGIGTTPRGGIESDDDEVSPSDELQKKRRRLLLYEEGERYKAGDLVTLNNFCNSNSASLKDLQLLAEGHDVAVLKRVSRRLWTGRSDFLHNYHPSEDQEFIDVRGLEYVAVSRVKKMEDTILTHPIRDAPLTTTEAPPSSEPVD